MISREIIKTLKFIVSRLGNQKINWALSGSLGLALRGIKVKPHDIDIISNKKGAYRIASLFKDYEFKKLEFSRNESFASYYGKAKINGIIVDIVGNFRKKMLDGSWTKDSSLRYKEFFNFRGIKIPLLSLEREYKTYYNNRSRKRLKTAQKIKEYLQTKELVYCLT